MHESRNLERVDSLKKEETPTLTPAKTPKESTLGTPDSGFVYSSKTDKTETEWNTKRKQCSADSAIRYSLFNRNFANETRVFLHERGPGQGRATGGT